MSVLIFGVFLLGLGIGGLLEQWLARKEQGRWLTDEAGEWLEEWT